MILRTSWLLPVPGAPARTKYFLRKNSFVERLPFSLKNGFVEKYSHLLCDPRHRLIDVTPQARIVLGAIAGRLEVLHSIPNEIFSIINRLQVEEWPPGSIDNGKLFAQLILLVFAHPEEEIIGDSMF